MKLHCPMCGTGINHPLDLHEIGTFVAAPFAANCSCGIELVMEFFFVNGQGRIGIIVHKDQKPIDMSYHASVMTHPPG